MGHEKKEMISFFLTTRCNLNCTYCYTNKNSTAHIHQTLDYEFAKAGIDDYYLSPYAHHVRFFGAGEPTVELGLMKKILVYAKEKDINTTSELQTNGCFNEDTARWVAENIDIIWISSDGVPKIQDYYRPTVGGGKSSEILSKNLKYLTKRAQGMVGIRTTITDVNVHNQLEMIQYFAGLGIKNFWVDPIFLQIGNESSNEVLDMEIFTDELLKTTKYAYEHGYTYGSILTCNFDEPGEYACRACISVPHLTTDGYVSACDMALFGNDLNHMNVFIYGKWNKETHQIIYDSDKIKLLQSRKLSNMSHCKECPVGVYCRGYCLGEVTNETKNLFGCKSMICEPTRKLWRELSEIEKQYTYYHP